MSEAMPPVALLAGGRATRLGALAREVPKSLLEVAGEPFIVHQFRLMRREGIERVVICAGYLAPQIQDFVGDGGRFGLAVTVSLDGARPLGTGGAIKRALPALGPRFLVMYGDSYLDTRLAPIVHAFRASAKPALMTVFRNDGKWDRSNVEFACGIIRRYDKTDPDPAMRYIDYGIGLLTPAIFSDWPDDAPFDLAAVYRRLVERHELAGHEVGERFYEIGSPAGLAETGAFLEARRGR